MPNTLTSYRIFIASPGGLESERETFRDVVNSYNETEAIERGVLFIPIGWEETLGGVGRPQRLINEDVMKSDYFVLMLWDRWGSHPDLHGTYTSGTEEEYSVALECYESAEHPMRGVVMAFKAVDPRQLADAGPQLEKVLDFKRTVESEKKHLFDTFDSTMSFENRLRRYLGQWLRDHGEGTHHSIPGAYQAGQVGARAHRKSLCSHAHSWQVGQRDRACPSPAIKGTQ